MGVLLFAIERGFAATRAVDLAWLTPAYAIVLMIWATAFVEAWKRRQAELAAEWDVQAKLKAAAAVRDEFAGEFRHGIYAPSGMFLEIGADALPDDAEAPLLEMVPAELPRMRQLCSSAIISTLLGATVVGSLALLVFRFFAQQLAGTGGTFAAAAANSLFIELMGALYKRAAVALTAWENHRAYEDHRDSLIVKLFVFSFLNKFFAGAGRESRRAPCAACVRAASSPPRQPPSHPAR